MLDGLETNRNPILRKKQMTFDEYMKKSAVTANYPDMEHNIYYPTIGLAGEAGEVANKVKKIMRDQGGVIAHSSRLAIADELGDCLWYIAALCRELDISLDKVAEKNIKKLYDRLERGKLQGDGDTR